MVAQHAGAIKLAANPARNLSASRNLGLALCAADIVAFIDDDGLPEPEWLVQILAAFDDPGRAYLPDEGRTEVATYAVPTSLELEDRTLRSTTLFRLSC